MRLIRIGTVVYYLGSGMSVNSKVHLILDLGKKLFGRLRRPVVVKSCGVNISYLLIEFPLGQPNFPNLFQLFFEIFLCQNSAAILQPLLVHDPALNRVVFDDGIGPFTELNSTFIVHFKANRNNHL